MRSRICFVILASFILAGVGCATGPEAVPKVSYRVSAKENFIKGKKAYEDEDYMEAIEYFKFVKNKFPYSSYATESDLLVADSLFGRDRYIEAADAYLNFIKLHPKHKKVGYASFRIGFSYYKRIPDDWFITPPAYELDQKETARAISELKRYLERFPDDEYAAEGRKLLAKAMLRMAEREHYVMRFYVRKDRFRGALWRANSLLKVYSGSGFDEEALLVKAESLVELGEPSAARTTLSELLQRFPEGDYADEAKALMERLPVEPKALKKAPKGDAAS